MKRASESFAPEGAKWQACGVMALRKYIRARATASGSEGVNAAVLAFCLQPGACGR